MLDAGTTTSLLSGYGQPGLLEVFAASRGDHETVLELLVQQGQASLHFLCVLRGACSKRAHFHSHAGGVE